MFFIRSLVCLLITGLAIQLHAQTAENGVIQGRVYNVKNNTPVSYATAVVWGTTMGALSDSAGIVLIKGIKPGYVQLKVTSVGYNVYTSEPILVTNSKRVFVDIPMEETQVSLAEVTIRASSFRKSEESPVSLRRIDIAEIEQSPGSNRDISRVIQSFPGVSSTPAYRNDVIVRGGGAAENRFYLDGIEIPNLNHFATQGSSGGPVGIINVDFIREVNFYSGAFPASKGNALSSVLEFSQIDGNKDKLKFRGSVGASDLALTLDGPLNKKTTFITSVRRSYLQFLFANLGLPFLPTYNDFQFKIRTRLDEKNEISFIGLGALDQNKLNLEADETESQRFILGYLPVNEQWSYTLGGVYKHFHKNGYDTWVLSRSHLNNVQYKYFNNVEIDSLRTLDYSSYEIENKFRYERSLRNSSGYKFNAGVNLEYAEYYNRTFQKLFNGTFINYKSYLSFIKWGVFGQVSKTYLDARLILSLGLRSDANSYSSQMDNLLDQVSPRFSISYAFSPKWTLNVNTGRYYQLPPYTALGLRDSYGELINKQNRITFVSADHLVTGFEYQPDQLSKLSIEAFYKWYGNYPLSVNDSISISSKSVDFGTFGDERVVSVAKGKAFGAELLYQDKNLAGFNIILSYTLVRSMANSYSGKFIPTAWDNKHILNFTTIRNFRRNWDVGLKWRFLGGAPYTPWDMNKSSLASAWDVQGRAYPDYKQFNQLRLKSFHQLDVRVDKNYYFNKWSLRFYIDVQNIYGFKANEPDQLIRQEGSNGELLPATGAPPRYPLKVLESEGGGTILPTVGIIVEL